MRFLNLKTHLDATLTLLTTTGAIAVDAEDRPQLGQERPPSRPHLGSACYPLKVARNPNSTPLTQSDIDQLGRLKTESVGIIENPPEVSTLLHRIPTGLFLTGCVVSLMATFAVSWILARRRYNQQSGVNKTTVQEAEANPASFSRASLGVRRLASTLFWLFTLGCILIGIVIGGSDFRLLASLGLIMGLLSWVLIRGIDWIIRGFKFGG